MTKRLPWLVFVLIPVTFVTACGGKKKVALPAASGPVAASSLANITNYATPSSTSEIQPCSALAEPDKTNAPPADSPVLYRCVELRFHPDNQPLIDPMTYYIRLKPTSLRSKKQWVPYNETNLEADFQSLWKTNFLDNLWIETFDEPYENGVMGKHVIFHLEERAKVKISDFAAASSNIKLAVDQSKIDQALKDKGIHIQTDAFVDESTIRKVQGVVKDLYNEKGFPDAEVVPQITGLAGGPKLVHLTFSINPGPKVQIRQVIFDGNKAITDRKLRSKMKNNKPKGWLSFITDTGTYQEAKYEEDAQNVQDYYHDRGYARARIGSPTMETLSITKDGKTRWIRLHIPVDEGPRYHLGKFEIADNTTVKTEYLRSLFKVKEGDWYSAKPIRKGLQKVQEAYGAAGYFEFTPAPMTDMRDLDENSGKEIPDQAPIVDLTVHMNEGKQYLVNRITFVGNTTTHDSVIRREMRVAEGTVFNMEALKYSIRRLNQLGYFKPLEKNEDIQVEKTKDVDGKLDVTLHFEEQNRNQLAFGAGVSQFDGFFGQLSFQTSNFLGRGETFSVSAQKGSQARNYQIAFTEPYLFDRPITAGIDLYSRAFIYPLQYTQATTGGNALVGWPVADFARTYLGYSYEDVTVKDINPLFLSPEVQLLLQQGLQRTVSKISPSYVYNTVKMPIFPDEGTRYTVGFDVAGLGGNTSYWMNRNEAVWYKKFTQKTSIGIRLQTEYIRPYGQTTQLPIFEKLYLGGEYSVRGFDIRSIGPRDPVSGLVLGGNKTLLFNAEYVVNVGGPVRVLAFYDAGQVKDVGQRFSWRDPITQLVTPTPNPLTDPFGLVNLTDPDNPAATPQRIVTGRSYAFKTSTGAEVRFFMPVLNIPFRLIMAYNPQRYGILNNNLQQQHRFTFRFAVGTTF